MEQQEAIAALDRALVKLSEQAEKDEDMALAMEVVQAERAETEYDAALAPEFAGEPKEPVRKEITALGAGGLTLIVAYVAGLAGLQMPVEVAAAIAAIVAAVAGYLKSESFLVGN